MSNDYFRFRQFTVHQQHCAMKVGTDGTLLGAWATSIGGQQRCDVGTTLVVSRTRRMQPPAEAPTTILDVGTGTGLIALMLAQRFPEACVTAIDIDREACIQAEKNIASSPFGDRITVINTSLQDYARERCGLFDCIVCNPPFFTSALLCPDIRRTMARHATSLTYHDLFDGVRTLMNDRGVFSTIIPTECRGDFESEASLVGLFIHRSCAVKTMANKPPRRYLLTFGKEPNEIIEASEVVIGSDYYKELTRDFYL